MNQRRVYLWIVLGLVAWGLFHAVGAYRFNHNPWRGVVVFSATAAFLGVWALLLAHRRRRLERAAREPAEDPVAGLPSP